MSRLPFAVLLAALLACRKPAPPAPPTPEALAAELATFPQLLAPVAPEAVDDFTAAVARDGAARAGSAYIRKNYIHSSSTVNGRKAEVFVGYAGPWQAPKGTALQPMSVQQFLRTFGSDAQTDIATVIAPKGNMFFTREQLPDIIAAARAAGARSEDLPFTVVVGSGR